MLKLLALALASRTKMLEEPIWRVSEVGAAVNAPAISSAARVNTWGCQHITIIATRIESGGNTPRRVADCAAFTNAEIAMSALAGDNFDGGRQCAILCFKLA